MKLIFGLGNPGLRYAVTRHNCGFLTLDKLAEKLGTSFSGKEQDNEVATARFRGEKVILAKPQSYMNLSGYPLSRLCGYYHVEQEDILVIYDDMSLEPGRLRFRRNGSDGGHNGIKSIIEQLGSKEFARLKIGIGQPVYDAALFVTTPFEKEEMPLFAEAFDKAADASLLWMEAGISVAMNRYNQKEKPEKKEQTSAESKGSEAGSDVSPSK